MSSDDTLGPPQPGVYPASVQNPDGTFKPSDGVHEGQRDLAPPQTPIVTGEYLDDFTALQIGMWQILDSLTFTSVDRLALITEGKVEKNEVVLTRIFLDWPDSEDDIIPVPSVTIMAPEEVELQLAGPLSGQQIIEDTQDKYRPGTVCKKLYELNARLEVVGWFAHKDERAAFRRALVEAFHEPRDERSGRRVTVSRYFDRVARFDLMGITYDDSPDFARSKQWPITARFVADIEAVSLVEVPVDIRPPRFNVTT